MTRSLTRRAALARLGGIAIAGSALSLPAARAAAQESTPAPATCGVPVGTSVPLVNVEGQTIAELTVAQITDPFTGYNPAYPPPRGSRFLLLTLTAKNVGANPWTIDPGRIFLQDTEGFTIYPAQVDLGAEPPIPGFGYQEIPIDTQVTGVIGYTVLKGVSAQRIFFAPASDRLILLAEMAV